jgi:HEAT repeat protein
MRRLIPVMAVLMICGCSKAPLTIHDKPLSYWLDEAKKPDAASRKKAVEALGKAATADRDAMAAVVAALKDADAEVRDAAVLALLNIGPSASDAANDLRELANQDPDPKVREHAEKALKRIEDR